MKDIPELPCSPCTLPIGRENMVNELARFVLPCAADVRTHHEFMYTCYDAGLDTQSQRSEDFSGIRKANFGPSRLSLLLPTPALTLALCDTRLTVRPRPGS